MGILRQSRISGDEWLIYSHALITLMEIIGGELPASALYQFTC